MNAMGWVFSLIGKRLGGAHPQMAILAIIVLFSTTAFGQHAFRDPLDHPAELQNSIEQRSLMAIAKAGSRLIAVGSRGLIVWSDNAGKSWAQASVPVQSDLLAVSFPTERDGWAVGHDGVILNTRDSGQTWTKQLDGRMAAEAFAKFYSDAGGDASKQAAAMLVAQNFKAGPALPYLGVWFENAEKGFAVGSFGMIVATMDGGKSWQPWMHRIDNQQSLNLNSIRGIGQNIYVVGEHGKVYMLDRGHERFTSLSTGYAGSFFGIAGQGKVLLAFGLRGVVFRSIDGGSQWSSVEMPTEATLTSGMSRGDASGFILANSAGHLLLSDALGAKFKVLSTTQPMRYTDLVSVADGSLVLTGVQGVRAESLSVIAK
ncbi:MAG: YCF48-related protein [Rhodocyclaceae bacterium]|nr:YCF48-related protein [Rhodocyclaceae bacterium]